MILGIDFDNTLACYDGIFHAEAWRRGLVPTSVPTHKTGVRDYLRSIGREPDFTELQGHVYGPGITAAQPYAGALDCLRDMIRREAKVYIISHKTKHPIIGPRHDLHQAARSWLKEKGFHGPGMLPPENVFLEESKEAKLARIAALACTHFIDDLPELLEHQDFPKKTQGLLFAPQAEDGSDAPASYSPQFRSWRDLHNYLRAEACAIIP